MSSGSRMVVWLGLGCGPKGLIWVAHGLQTIRDTLSVKGQYRDVDPTKACDQGQEQEE